jgi:GNAT superfamily N-acetyltransferase
LTAIDGILVARYTAEHWRDVWTLRLCQLAEHGIVLGPEAIPSEPRVVERGAHEWDYHQIHRVYMAGRGGFWLAWLDGVSAGHVGAQDLGDGVELRRMYVRQEFRRRGIGMRLVRELAAHCAAQGVGAIELWTGERGPGRALYERVGFRVVAGPGLEFGEAADRTAYEPGADEVRMRLAPLALPDA